MKLTSLAVYRPVVALTVTLALTLFGAMSYFSLGLENNPELNLPFVTVTAVYPGASAQTVEEQVTRPLEDSISSLGGIKTMTSNSQVSLSQITIEFEEGVNVDIAASDVQQKVSSARRDLPSEVEEPSYSKLDFNDIPIVNLAVTSTGEADPVQLYQIANDVVRPRLEGVPGVGRVTVVGGREPEVQVEVQPERLRAFGLTIADVTTAVQQQYLATSGGQMKTGSGANTQSTSLRLDTRGGDLATLQGVPLNTPGGGVIQLRDVANIFMGGKESDTILRLNGQASAGLLVYKQSSANITQVADAVIPQVEKINSTMPRGFGLELVIDQSKYVRETVAEVQHELELACLITGIVLFFFLHSVRSTIIVMLAIPTSLLVALIVMKLTGQTLNGMSLIGLTTAIGVLVDDSIVVLENIFSHLERGEEPRTAAIDGRSEIGMAAIAITLVDVAVWGPIIFISGITGAFLRAFAIVMVAATLASLLVSFTLTPLIASRWLKSGHQEGGKPNLLGRFARLFEPGYRRLESAYRVVLHWSLRHRPVVIVGALLVFASNWLIVANLGSEFVPEGDMDTQSVVGELPAGTAVEATDRAARRWEMLLLDKERFPEIHSAYVQIGAQGNPRQIQVTLDVGKPSTRTRTGQEIARAAITGGEQIVPEMQARRNSEGGPSGQPVQIRVFGDNLDQLGQAAESAKTALSALPELADVTNSLSSAEEITIRPDLPRLRDLGITAQQIGTSVRVAYQGATVAKWAEPTGKERDVRVTLPAAVRNQAGALENLPLIQRGDRMLTLQQVAHLERQQKPTTITRVDRQRVATLGAEPLGVPLGQATEEATKVMNVTPLPSGMRWELAGTGEEQQNSFTALILGIAASIVLMYLVLTVLYESWLQPVLILTALPLASVGAFLGLLLFGQTLNVASFIGIIALFGLVGKNAILLVDRANDLRRDGHTREQALEEAGPHRLRPILMTSAVLIFSMLPVAAGLSENSSGRAPLAAVLVGGMATSTLLSLLYVPVAYTYFDSLAQVTSRAVRWRPRGWRQPHPIRHEQPLPVAGGAASLEERVDDRLRTFQRARRRRRPALA
ncbi:MAG: efflux RND transporter permease subunit [Chloroflexi bacterium]|nr:efflux RND transporter permease subunit [Chloroflexota bacterium]